MNIQFKKGVLNLCVLVLLDKQDRYGYELVQKISDQISISEGSVYPLLRRLTKEGYFTTYLHEQLKEWNSFTNGVNTLIEESVKND